MLANSGEFISKIHDSVKNDEDQPCHNSKLPEIQDFYCQHLRKI